MIVVSSEKESFSSSIVLEKMESMQVTSCNLLPGSKLMTVAPFKDNYCKVLRRHRVLKRKRVSIAQVQIMVQFSVSLGRLDSKGI